MKIRIGITFTVFLAALVLTAIKAYSQGSNNVQRLPDEQNGVAGTRTDPAKEKGEVDLKLEELNARHEVVLGHCIEKGKCEPLKGHIVDEHLIKEVVDGDIINIPKPAYPALARAAHASGIVAVQVIIDEDGKVMAAQVLRGHPLLHAAALKAAREARFTPTLLNNKAVKIAGVIDYNFVL
jgi:TonB family protein